jgi:hypothetical protein
VDVVSAAWARGDRRKKNISNRKASICLGGAIIEGSSLM